MPRSDPRKPRKTPRQARAKATLDAILTAAAHILVDVGYDRANVNDVAKRAGVSIGSLYQYYPSKEALMTAVIQRQSDIMTALFEDGLPDVAQLPVREAVRECVRRGLAVFAHEPALRRVIAVEAPTLAAGAATPDWDASMEIAFREFLRFHQDQLRRPDVELATRIVKVAVEAIATSFAVHDPDKLSQASLHEEVADLVCRYLLKEP